MNHNVKAIYQRYLGWYDGNPAHLWQHPPEAAARRYVGRSVASTRRSAKAQEFLDEGDLRFAAELASHAVFAEPDHGLAHDAPRRRAHPTRLRLGVRNVAQLLPAWGPRS